MDSKHKTYNIVSPDTLVLEALEMLNTINHSYLIVMDGDQYKGLFSERDYSRNVVLKGLISKQITVKEVMSVELPIVSLSDTVELCMHLMISFKTRYLLAYSEDQEFIGVVTIHDLLREVLACKEEVFDHLKTLQLLDQEGELIY